MDEGIYIQWNYCLFKIFLIIVEVYYKTQNSHPDDRFVSPGGRNGHRR